MRTTTRQYQTELRHSYETLAACHQAIDELEAEKAASHQHRVSAEIAVDILAVVIVGLIIL